MSLRLGLTLHPVRCVWCFPMKLKEPIFMKISNSIASLNPIKHFELRSVPNVLEMKNPNVSYSEEADEKKTKTTKEEERRRKIGLANKGKVPWNKGRKHTDDTRRRIKQRTIEALRNPKVRKKMSEHQQPHSDETKEKIRASVKQVWEERLRSKRVKERFMSLWSENIAEAARRGGDGEVELDWDSYEDAKREISSSEERELAEEKARVKEQNKLRAEEAKAREERDRRRERKMRKPKQKNENTTIASCSKLKKKLTKIHKKKISRGMIAIGKDKVVSVAAKLEKLDLELIRKERTRGDISLADQIQAAKNRRGSDVLSRFEVFAHEMN